RLKSRVKVLLDDGGEAGLFLERGRILRHGDLLQSACGMVVEVHAAPESVSAVYCDDALQLARACYHLGNRHIPLEIGDGRVAYQPDHVLDDMVRGFGLVPRDEMAPFEPEAGAYGGNGGHGHG
ncbi:MAG: urease accessory protein UreE, partial [Pseudomonadota bacterium]